MNWHIGQEIVCVKTHSKRRVVRGKTYTINSLIKSPCKCGHVLISVCGINSPTNLSRCVYCQYEFNNNGIFWLHEELFAPLDADISELTEILEQPIKQVVEL